MATKALSMLSWWNTPSISSTDMSGSSWEKQASRRTVRRRLWFMALSTSELVADSLSASSVGGASGARLVFASAFGPGFGAWLVEA